MTNLISGIFQKPIQKAKKVEQDKLALLATELALAGVEVLKEDFDFTEEDATRFLNLMLNRAKANRANIIARAAVQAIDQDG